MKLTIFYSWQSDLPSKLCRDFIRLALEDAAERIRAARGIEVAIDHDTKGVPGTPPINQVILRKIDACDVFLADMTYVGSTADQKKALPNPNVMGEYGYALKTKGWDRILLVLNEAFGPSSELPFDLRHHRYPATYNLAAERPVAARRKARERLAERLEEALNAVADDVIAKTPAPPDYREPLRNLAISTLNARSSNNPPIIVSRPYACICVAPAQALDSTILEPKAVEAVRHFLAASDDYRGIRGQDHTQWWEHGSTERVGDLPNPEGRWCGRLLKPGVVEHVFTIAKGVGDDPRILVQGWAVEAVLVDIADRALALLGALGLSGPTLVATFLYDLRELDFAGPKRVGRFPMQSLGLAQALVPEGERKSGELLKPAFDELWLAAGFSGGSPSFEDGEGWAGYKPHNSSP
jgi:hypothetical protein